MHYHSFDVQRIDKLEYAVYTSVKAVVYKVVPGTFLRKSAVIGYHIYRVRAPRRINLGYS